MEATYALYFSPDVSRGWSNDRFFFSPPFFFLFFFLLPVDSASKHPVSGSFCVLV